MRGPPSFTTLFSESVRTGTSGLPSKTVSTTAATTSLLVQTPPVTSPNINLVLIINEGLSPQPNIVSVFLSLKFYFQIKKEHMVSTTPQRKYRLSV